MDSHLSNTAYVFSLVGVGVAYGGCEHVSEERDRRGGPGVCLWWSAPKKMSESFSTAETRWTCGAAVSREKRRTLEHREVGDKSQNRRVLAASRRCELWTDGEERRYELWNRRERGSGVWRTAFQTRTVWQSHGDSGAVRCSQSAEPGPRRSFCWHPERAYQRDICESTKFFAFL